MSDHDNDNDDPMGPIRQVVQDLQEQATKLGLEIVAPPQLILSPDARHPDALTLTFSIDPDRLGDKAAEIDADREAADFAKEIERFELEEARRAQSDKATDEFEAERRKLMGGGDADV
jgi:hypothetical protein